jgi:Pilus formation protein N terminal region
MSRLVLNAAAAMSTLLAFGAAAMAAEMLKRPSRILELQPGMTKILPADRPVQAIAIGNPNIADASVINLGAIAITGKGAGLTNVILFDAEGKEIFNSSIQVVGADAYRGSNYVKERHEIRVVSLWGGPSSNKEEKPEDRRYLCAQNCSAVQYEHPIELNPPGNTSAPVGTTTSKTLTNLQTPQAATSEAPAPQGK